MNLQIANRNKYFRNYKYSKSHITFDEFEKKANKAFEFGNDWGLYVDIENCDLYYDTHLERYRYKYNLSTIYENNYNESGKNSIKNNKNMNNDNSDNAINKDNSLINKFTLLLIKIKNIFVVKRLSDCYFICILFGSIFIIRNYFIINKFVN